MNVYPLINDVKSRIAYRLPRHIPFDDIVNDSYQDIIETVAVKVHFALEQAMLGAQSVLKSQADEYISGLKINEDLSIGIEDDVKYLEYGYGSWNMLDNLLTGPKAKTAKDGSLYNIIPVGKQDSSKIKRSMRMKAKDVISGGSTKGVSNRKLQDIVDSMEETLKMAKDTKPQGPQGFATASSKQNSSEKWVHPGFMGVRQLDFINVQLRNDLIESVMAIIEDRSMRMV